MRLEKAQKELAIKWLAAGYETDEVNRRAADCEPPFEISRRQATYYRNTRNINMDAIQEAGEENALTEGLALREVRVARLKDLAERLGEDLFGRRLWLDQVKAVGSGPLQEIVEYEDFNAAEVREYRATLDDIAKELGHRAQRTELTGIDGGPIETKDADSKEHNRAISTLADAVGALLSGAARAASGGLEAAEQDAMDGSADEG